MHKFSHMGLPTDEKQPGEIYVESTKVWVTEFKDHPYKVEYLRYEPDSPVTGPLRDLPHMAFETDDLAADLEGQEVIMEPFVPMPGLTVAFIVKDGAVFEYMQYE
ncbi:MAG TPA: hypothetical protein QGH10_14080 [Armatimonadota bacterium]|jgi:hypothetical protein|nr:hypothetical protein [Armatimonadota bacterium]